MAPSLNFSANFTFKEQDADSKFVVWAKSKGKSTYSVNSKKFGIPIFGSYRLGEREYECNTEECLVLYDLGRGVFNYNTNWIWVATTVYLPDKRPFAINIVDGEDPEIEGD